MDSFKMNRFVDELDEHMKLFSKKYLREIEEYKKSGNNTYICYERLLSNEVNNFIANYIDNIKNVDLLLSVSEFPIKINNEKNLANLKKEVDINNLKHTWDVCFVDGYFKCLINGENKHFFVEYKLQNNFIYADLATDFLKYKLYTQHFTSDSIFVYVIFKKEENYPSVLNRGNKYYLLPKEIARDTLYDSNIYIYNEKNYTLHDEKIKKLPELVKKMNQFSKYSSELIELKENEIEDVAESAIVYLNFLPKFNSRVVKSHLINFNYRFIFSLWNNAKSKGLFNLFIIEEKNKGIEYIKKITDEASKNYSNIDLTISNEDRYNAEKNGIRGSSYASLNLLAFLEFFGETYDVQFDKPDYRSKYIGKGSNKKELKYQETANFRKQKLKQTIKSDKDLLDISYPILNFLVKVYNILYVIDEEKNEIIEEKTISKLLKLEEELQDIYNKVAKLLGMKKKIKIKDIKDDGLLKELFYCIYERYK